MSQNRVGLIQQVTPLHDVTCMIWSSLLKKLFLLKWQECLFFLAKVLVLSETDDMQVLLFDKTRAFHIPLTFCQLTIRKYNIRQTKKNYLYNSELERAG